MSEGFAWDQEVYTESAGGEFVDKKVFAKLMANDTTVEIVEIREGISPGYNGGAPRPQWLVDFITPDGEEYTKGIDKGNEERNDRVRRIASTIEATGQGVQARFDMIGKRQDIFPPKQVAV